MTQPPNPSSTTPPKCDVLLFVATKTEKDALYDAAKARGITPTEQKSSIGLFYSLGTLGNRRVLAVKTSTGGLGPTGSAANARFYVEATNAENIILVGMAFGIDPKSQKAGEVLVSSHVFPYDDRLVQEEDADWQYDYSQRSIRQYKANEGLLRAVNEFLRKKNNKDRARVGCLLTGSALIYSTKYRDYLVDRASRAATNIIGGEMEAVGLLSLHPRDRAIWLVVKGVSDFAAAPLGEVPDEANPVGVAESLSHDPKVPTDPRKLACTNAAGFGLDFLTAWQ